MICVEWIFDLKDIILLRVYHISAVICLHNGVSNKLNTKLKVICLNKLHKFVQCYLSSAHSQFYRPFEELCFKLYYSLLNGIVLLFGSTNIQQPKRKKKKKKEDKSNKDKILC